jgi:hypothetical protein
MAAALARCEHEVQVVCDLTRHGRGQIILRDPETGVLCGGTEARADSHIAVYRETWVGEGAASSPAYALQPDFDGKTCHR